MLISRKDPSPPSATRVHISPAASGCCSQSFLPSSGKPRDPSLELPVSPAQKGAHPPRSRGRRTFVTGYPRGRVQWRPIDFQDCVRHLGAPQPAPGPRATVPGGEFCLSLASILPVSPGPCEIRYLPVGLQGCGEVGLAGTERPLEMPPIPIRQKLSSPVAMERDGRCLPSP